MIRFSWNLLSFSRFWIFHRYHFDSIRFYRYAHRPHFEEHFTRNFSSSGKQRSSLHEDSFSAELSFFFSQIVQFKLLERSSTWNIAGNFEGFHLGLRLNSPCEEAEVERNQPLCTFYCAKNYWTIVTIIKSHKKLWNKKTLNVARFILHFAKKARWKFTGEKRETFHLIHVI